jgi:hypothetical protein
MLRQAAALPGMFLCGRFSSGGYGFDCVVSGDPGVTGHVGSSGGVTGGTGDRSGRSVIGGSRGGVGGNGGGARCAALYLTTRPGTRGFNGFARSVILRVLLLEEWKHMLGAVGGPERK